MVSFKGFLSEWQLRGSFLGSLLIQVFQILPGNIRKRNSSNSVTVFLWILYTAADKVATYAISIVSRSITDPFLPHNRELVSFWTTILVLHLGGPDTITAFSLDDNQLWLRQVLTLVTQLGIVVYILFRALWRTSFSLFIFLAIVCISTAGFLKYVERIWALYRASMDGLRKSMMNDGNAGPSYVDIVETYSFTINAGILAHRQLEHLESSTTAVDNNTKPEKPEVQTLKNAYYLFMTFRRLFVDLILTFEDRANSLSIFNGKDASAAFEMVEIELNFAYDALYTKAFVAHSPPGRIIRVVNIVLVPAACILFALTEKHGFHDRDVFITYLLLVGTLGLEIASLLVFIVSDWTVVLSNTLWLNQNCLEQVIPWILSLVRKTFLCLSRGQSSRNAKSGEAKRYRWSHSMKQVSLLSYCLHDHQTCFQKLLARLKAKEYFDKYKYTKCEKIPTTLEELIWENLKGKAQISEDAEKNRNRTDWRGKISFLDRSCPELKWISELEFDECLLLWHVATDICYHHCQETRNSGHQGYRKASKLISCYMIYLLVAHPLTLSSAAVIGLIRYRDTCAELIQIFKEDELIGEEPDIASKNLLFMHTDLSPKRVKGDNSKSVLWDAVELAKELIELGEERMWKTMCDVWIEMLRFVARNCRGDYHAKLLSVGGELLTFVWLLEAHLGMGDYFQIKSGDVTTIIRIEKDR
ncbi:unnamed protein product [Ilex paraguariensis]|uniref:DUF4220 domain-containing protein n=1 Tax=Ilex paraguariensis TaxID=185542 RepID=A0ABC8QYL0_9AQUA